MSVPAQFNCSGQAAAPEAGKVDQCQCADCRLFFPGGTLWCFPHGNICDGCKDERQDTGLDSEAFGTSPRQVTPSLSRTVALPTFPTSEPQGSNRA